MQRLFFLSFNYRFSALVSIALLGLLLIGTAVLSMGVQAAPTAPSLNVSINAAYNLVVDSNATSPSTYAPSVATVIGRFCNDGDVPLTNVYGHIGDYGASSPGLYPERDSSDAAFQSEHLALANTGLYAFQHVGGRIGTADASRLIGELDAGECSTQYWHFTYPQCSGSEAPPCSGVPTWGESVKPEDDLWLSFDMWGTSVEAGTANASWTMTMRNEISAMANKIRPNPDGRWFNTDTSVVQPGGIITTNGILYELGNIRHGFDNDGDFQPDFNAWLQPFGDPAYDPSCFRLIGASTVLTVSRSAGSPTLIINSSDSSPDPTYGGPLYFTNLPNDNTGVRGKVYYSFLAMNGPCALPVTPYQEVASGFDNEKFNGDYGTGIPPVQSSQPEVSVIKTGDGLLAENQMITYNIEVPNSSATEAAGLFLSIGDPIDAPVMISDTVPVGLQYVGASAALNTTNYAGSATIRFSTDGGATWSTSDPGSTPSTAGSKVLIQWWLSEPIPAGGSSSATATFQALIPTGYINDGGDPFIENCGDGRFGDGTPFAEDCAMTLVQGTATIGDLVWQDDDGDGFQDVGESGLNGVPLLIYWDKDNNGQLDPDIDLLLSTQNSIGTTEPNYDFTQLPAGNYLVTLDLDDPDVPTGYSVTTAEVVAVALADGEDYNDADFGVGPTLDVVKSLTSLDPAYVGETVSYQINLYNTLPGDGTADSFCTYNIWASEQPPADGTPASGSNNSAWQDIPSLLGRPDGTYAYTILANNADDVGTSGFNLSGQSGNITSVRLVAYATELKDLQANASEYLRLDVYRGNAAVQTYTYDGAAYFTGPGGSEYVIDQPLTGIWSWADFQGNATELRAIGSGTGSPANRGDIGLDAVAYVVTTDQQCGGASKTIATLPLTDTYNSTYLEFISADPSPSSMVPGTLTWDNLGPLYPGGSRTVTVNFRALATTVSTVNNASVTNAFFGNGRAVNEDSDDATVGIQASGTIQGHIWAESNLTNEWTAPTGYNAGDTFIAGTTVELWGCFAPVNGVYQLLTTPGATNKECADAANGGAWELMTTQQAAADGSYAFTSLRPGYYNVKVDETTLPTGFSTRTAEASPSGNGAGAACGTCDGQWNGEAANLNTFNNLTSGETITNVSFGYRGDGAINGYVWNDRDGDGVWDSNEEPIPGSTIYLCTIQPCNSGNATQTTTTDANGFYSFGSLTAGTYYVGVLTPSGMSQSGDPDEAGACVTCDNQTGAINLASGQVLGTFDFGYTGGLEIGDTVYTDWNGNGQQDSGEEGVDSVQIELYRDIDGDGEIDAGIDLLLDTETTSSTGFYNFTNLSGDGNSYIVKIAGATIPSGYAQTGDPDEGAVPCTICDGKSSVTLTTANVDTEDFGYQPQGFGSIGDYIWLDSDSDGSQDNTESGLNGVTVNLYEDNNGDGILDANDALVTFTVTSGNGDYLFQNLAPGRYLVMVDESSAAIDDNGYSLTTNNQPLLIMLGAGENYLDADFGYATALIGDYVWQDNNGDGMQDTHEPGIAGVTVELLSYTESSANPTDPGYGRYNPGVDTLGSIIDATTTDAEGLYTFGSLAAGDYVARIAAGNFGGGQPLETMTLTGDPDAYGLTAGTSVPPCDPADGVNYAYCDGLAGSALALGQEDRTYDFGYQPEGVLGDRVWRDSDGDGIQDAGELGIPGVTVYLCTSTPCNGGNATATAVTDADGLYSFGNLSDGTYHVEVETGTGPLLGMSQTSANTSYTVTGGSSTDALDFGYTQTGSNSVSGTVFYDINNNGGLYEGGSDLPYPDVSVTLYQVDCGTGTCSDGDETYTAISTTSTDGNGFYSFSGLPDGDYVISINGSDPRLQVPVSLTTEPDNTDCAGGGITCNTYNQTSVSGGSASTNNDYGVFANNLDCGDLPTSYNMTSLAAGGACHTIAGPYLGALVDADSNGQADAGATGDDLDGSDDEDGVVHDMSTLWTPGATVNLTVTVSGGSGTLIGWFDWNNDGDFNDAYEIKQFGSLPVGENPVALTIPNNGSYSTDSDIFVRFRLYSGSPASFSPAGAASGGEVEDYLWSFGPTAVGFSRTAAGSATLLWWPATLMLALGTALLIWRHRKTA